MKTSADILDAIAIWVYAVTCSLSVLAQYSITCANRICSVWVYNISRVIRLMWSLWYRFVLSVSDCLSLTEPVGLWSEQWSRQRAIDIIFHRRRIFSTGGLRERAATRVVGFVRVRRAKPNRYSFSSNLLWLISWKVGVLRGREKGARRCLAVGVSLYRKDIGMTPSSWQSLTLSLFAMSCRPFTDWDIFFNI